MLFPGGGRGPNLATEKVARLGTELRNTAILDTLYGAGDEGGGLCWAQWPCELAMVSTSRPPAAISR